MKKSKKEEKTLAENLQNPAYVNYNLLLRLEEIKNILLATFELNKQMITEEPEEQREGILG